MGAQSIFSQRAKALRLGGTRRLTQAEVAEAVGVARATVSAWETGGDMPGRESLRALAQVLGTTVDYLQGGDPPRTKSKTRQVVEGSDEFALLQFWDAIDDDARAALISMARVLFDGRRHAS